jgi:hypothetical protein
MIGRVHTERAACDAASTVCGAGVPRSNVFGKLSMLGRPRLPVNPYRNAATVFSRFRTVFHPFTDRFPTVFTVFTVF